ncbi:MAG: tetratricopeptide repeat protein, partial [Deltaproteobacteria bacterium]|nr:tetratricopeptide repeat protein [Deltaproteobacteria bacterium]
QDATESINTLLNEYTGNSVLPHCICSIAQHHQANEKYNEAENYFNYLLGSWPGNEQAIWAYKGLIEIKLDSASYAEAEVLLNRFTNLFSARQQAPGILRNIAEKYEKLGQYDKAEELSRDVATNQPGTKKAVQAQANLVILAIKQGKYDEARTETDKLLMLPEYSRSEWITGPLMDITSSYRRANRPEECERIYNYIVSNWPEPDYTGCAQKVAVAIANIGLGRDAQADALLDSLIVDHNDVSDLPGAISRIEEAYYIRILSAETWVRENYLHPVEIWQKVMEEFPDFFHPDPDLYYFIADCYRQIDKYEKATTYYNKAVALSPDGSYEYRDRGFIVGDKHCGAYAVWHTLTHYKLDVPINTVVTEMEIQNKGFTSLYDIVQTLKSNGISAHAVQLPFNKIGAIDRPFIQYLAPMVNGSLGHFVLCIPTGSDKAVVLDGAKDPKVVDLSFYKCDNYDETRWDGTSILIEKSRDEYLQDLISQIIKWKSLLRLAERWLEADEYDGYCLDELVAYSELSLDEQLFLHGGCWSDYDCIKQGQNCLDRPACSCHHDCFLLGGTYGCGDITEEKKCVLTASGIIPCRYDPARNCAPKRKYVGDCSTPTGGRCQFAIGSYADCDGRWLFQCHDGW